MQCRSGAAGVVRPTRGSIYDGACAPSTSRAEPLLGSLPSFFLSRPTSAGVFSVAVPAIGFPHKHVSAMELLLGPAYARVCTYGHVAVLGPDSRIGCTLHLASTYARDVCTRSASHATSAPPRPTCRISSGGLGRRRSLVTRTHSHATPAKQVAQHAPPAQACDDSIVYIRTYVGRREGVKDKRDESTW